MSCFLLSMLIIHLLWLGNHTHTCMLELIPLATCVVTSIWLSSLPLRFEKWFWDYGEKIHSLCMFCLEQVCESHHHTCDALWTIPRHLSLAHNVCSQLQHSFVWSLNIKNHLLSDAQVALNKGWSFQGIGNWWKIRFLNFFSQIWRIQSDL